MSKRNALLAVWEAWDEHPTWEHLANDMEDACQAHAPTPYGTLLRVHLSEARRQGISREQAVDTWRSPVTDPKRVAATLTVADCENCELWSQCTGPVPFRGDPGRLAVMGEAPGAEEDLRGQPFVGPSGQLLEQLLVDAGIEDDYGVYNTVSCFPHGTPNWEHIDACAHNRKVQLDYLNPTFVLLLGKVALKATDRTLEIKYGRGRPLVIDGRIFWATYHPAAALRNGNYRTAMEYDLDRFAQMLHAGGTDVWQEYIPDACIQCNMSACWWDTAGYGWCQRHVPERERANFDTRQELIASELDEARLRLGKQRDANAI